MKKRKENEKGEKTGREVRKVAVHRMLTELTPFWENYGSWAFRAMKDYHPGKQIEFRMVRQSFEFYVLVHVVTGAGTFAVEHGNVKKFAAGDMLLCCPGEVLRLGGVASEDFLVDAIHFTGRAFDELHKAGMLKSDVYHWGEERVMAPIIQNLQNPALAFQVQGVAQLQALLMAVYTRGQKKEALDYVDTVIEAVKNDIGHWWTIEEMAKLAQVSTCKFRRDFLYKTGMLPKNYVEAMKMKVASGMLSSACNVSATAERLGYRDQYHFSKRYKHFFGYPPSRDGVFRGK